MQTSISLRWATIGCLAVSIGWEIGGLPQAVLAADPAPAAAVSSEVARRLFDGAVALHKGAAFDLAVDDWEKFVKTYPDDPLAAQAQFFAGVCYLSQKDKQYDKAADAFDKVVAKYPKFEQLDKAYFNLGLADYNLAQAGKGEFNAKAADAFGQLVSKFPTSPQIADALLYRGESLYATGKKDEAVKSWTELATKPANTAARARGLYNLGIAQQESGQQGPAAATFETLLKDYPQNELAAEVTMRKLDAYLETGKLAEAEKQFAVEAAKPNFALADYAQLRLGATLAAEKKYGEAATAYGALTTKFTKSSYIGAATLAAGNCYYLAGNQGEARSWLGKVLAGGGDQAIEAAHWIARSWLKDKNPGEALAVVEKTLPRADKSSRKNDLLMDQADALYDIPGRRGESAALYAKLVDKNSKDPKAADTLLLAGSAALGAADYAGALSYAETFQKTFPGHALTPDVKFVAAEALLLSGKHAEAEKAYEELLAKYPQHADIEQWTVRRALTLYLRKQYGDVVRILESQLVKLKQPDRIAEAQFLVGSSQLEQKQYGDAVKSLKAAMAAQPKSPQTDETLMALAIAQRGAGDAAGATETNARLLAEFPNSKLADRAHYRQAEARFESGDFGGAAAEYQWVVDHAADSPLAPNALVGLGWSKINTSDFKGAEKIFTQVLDKHSSSPAAKRARYGRAAARQQLRDFAGGAEDAEAFLKADPNSNQKSDVLYVLGLCQEGLKKNGDAVKSFETLVAADPKYSGIDKVLYELAWSRKADNREDAAADAFGKLAHEHGDSPLAAESWFNVGEYQYHQKKDFRAAAEAYFSAFGKAGKSDLGEKADHKLGWAYYQQQAFDKAQQAFASQLAAYPNGSLAADAAFMIGESLFKQNQYEAALAAFEKARPMKPSTADFSALNLLHSGQCLGQLKKWEASLKLFDQLIKEYPTSPHVVEGMYEQGWAKQNLDRLDDAFKLYETVAEKTDGVVGARARFMMGEVLFTQGNHKEAIRNFFKVAYGFGDTQAPEPYKVWQANATYEAARCFEVMKNLDQSKKLYNELTRKYPNSDKVELAKKRLKELGGGR